MNKELM